MLVRYAEESFQKGIRALNGCRIREALAFFEAAIELEKRFGVQIPQARYLSFYGLCLSLHGRRLHEAVDVCRLAVKLDEFNADMHANLTRVLLAADLKREAYQTLARGLRTHSDHVSLRRLWRQMGARRKPVIPFLGRGNPINVALGRMVAGGKKAPPSGAARRVSRGA
ncbi:MAG: tetratricopeptide repeat protein [bacterium]|nr:tetratricopeptide repeat protein [bacterium]